MGFQSYAQKKEAIYKYMKNNKEKYNECCRIKQKRYYDNHKEYFKTCKLFRKIDIDYFLV